jgi:hypothetical protein
MHSTECLAPSPPPGDSTGPYQRSPTQDPEPAGRVAMALVRGGELVPAEQIQTVLRQRLKVLGLIGLCTSAVAMIVTLPNALKTA